MSKLKFNKKNINPHKELFRLSGLERYEAIVELKVSERNFICGFYKMCDECPLALYFDNEDGFCADCATEFDIRSAIKYGAKFVGEEAKK